MRGESGFDPEYIAARDVLLDALEALGEHRRSVVLVGAQAIYLRVGEGDLAVAPYTTDGDLALDPRLLGSEPPLSHALKRAGFVLSIVPGTWSHAGVSIDFLVPDGLSPSGRRGARLGAHGSEVARKASGLEAAIVDYNVLHVSSLGGEGTRGFDLRVAGVAGLLVAKLHKIADRAEALDRRVDKDALDVLRLLRHAETTGLARTLTKLEADPIAGEATHQARRHLEKTFGRRDSVGPQMAVRATQGLEDADEIALSCAALATRLLSAWRR